MLVTSCKKTSVLYTIDDRSRGLFRSMIEISLKAEELFHIGNFPVTNSIVVSGIVLVLLLFIGWRLKKKLSLIPGTLQNILEIVIEGFLDLMDSVLGERKKTEKYLPLIVTIFFMVIFSNWLGLLPGVGSIGLNEVHHGDEVLVPLFRSPSADLNFTLAIAIIAVLSVNLFGILAIGFKKYFNKFFNLKGIPTFVGLLEFVSELAKMVSFSFRLFGNIFAGEVLLIIVGFLVPYVIPLPFLFLEIFVGFIQAFVFSMLTLVFIAIATTEEAH